MSRPDVSAPPRGEPHFVTTRWSLVVAAGQGEDSASGEALAELCQAYWFPVYAYVRRRVGDVHQAQDLTQSFFQKLLEKHVLATAKPDRGRFRAFLLTACKRFLINEWHKDRAEKRGGGRSPLSLDFELGDSRYAAEAVDTLTPELLFEQQWAITLLARVLEQLKGEWVEKHKAEQFDVLKQFLSGSKSPDALDAAAKELGSSTGAVKVAAHRLRQRYRELMRAEIAQTVTTAEDVDDEIRSLFAVLGSERSK